MSTSPIQYESEKNRPPTSPTELGGRAGPIQPAPHDLTAAEALGILVRAGMRGDTGDTDVISDPDTGRALPADQNLGD